jgi:hypothetical protein
MVESLVFCTFGNHRVLKKQGQLLIQKSRVAITRLVKKNPCENPFSNKQMQVSGNFNSQRNTYYVYIYIYENIYTYIYYIYLLCVYIYLCYIYVYVLRI